MAASSTETLAEYWFVFQRDQLLILKNQSDVRLLTSQHILPLESAFIRRHSLGYFLDSNIYCAEVSQDFSANDNLAFIPIRHALETLGDEWYSMLVKAYSIINWDKNHRFCGRCGAETTKGDNTYERVCPSCRLTFYPRISPCIIVRINKGDQLLMARSHHFNPGIYAFIAGFVEPGETLEETVRREVKEEVGIQIKNLSYFGSQAWPFPDSLMMSFTAEYAGGDLMIDPKEIEEAGWYDYEKLPGFPSSRISIARKLIDQFITEKKAKKT
jgi:NAD+ diphosphatase